MSNPILPVIITGPAVLEHNGHFIYVQKDIVVKEQTESFHVESAYGRRDERHKSRVIKISFTPVGELRSTSDVAKYYPFGPADIGKSIFPASPTVKIHSIAESKTYIFQRGGITKFPELILSPTRTVFGPMEITCLGKADTQPTDAAYWKDATLSQTFADNSYEDARVLTDIYSAAIGSRPAPFNAIGSMDGFRVLPELVTRPISAGDVGIGDIKVQSLWVTCEFAPSNLTEAEVDSLLGLQGSAAVLPGQSYAKGGENLVISSDAFTCTLYRMGARESERVYEATEHRHKRLLFTPQRYGNVAAASPLWLFEVN